MKTRSIVIDDDHDTAEVFCEYMEICDIDVIDITFDTNC